MTETPSQMIPLGTKAPDFTLIDVSSNKSINLQEYHSEVGTVIMFLCNHCPYVKHIQKKLVEVAKYYQQKNIIFIAISSNDIVTYPQDGPALMRVEAEKNHYSFPYLYDETQHVAKAYHATCTPDFYVFDKDLICIYRGRFDDSTPGNNKPVTGHDLSECLENLINHRPINSQQKPSLGCNIKWKR